jgi:hypothetical protein
VGLHDAGVPFKSTGSTNGQGTKNIFQRQLPKNLSGSSLEKTNKIIPDLVIRASHLSGSNGVDCDLDGANHIVDFKTLQGLSHEVYKHWTISQLYLLPLLNSVGTIPLHHIYGYSKQLNTYYNNTFIIQTDNTLSSVISGDFNNNWFQLSYSAGDLALFLNRLKLKYPSKFKQFLNDNLKQLKIPLHASKVESYFWLHAIHYWKSNFDFDLHTHVRNSIYPHPVKLKHLWIAGESFSSIQGWIEGCLETSDMVLQSIYNTYVFKPIQVKKGNFVYLDDRVLDIIKWKKFILVVKRLYQIM